MFIPFGNIFASPYVLYFLTRYPYEHDSRWQSFTQQAQSAGSKLGMVVVSPLWNRLERRSFALYFILTLITFGLFGIYWLYALLKDPNEHFLNQRQFEDNFVAALT